MLVLYWMTPDPITATEEDSLLSVWRALRAHGIRRLPVVRGGDRLVGLIGRSDLYRYVSRERFRGSEEEVRAALEGVPVREAMTADPATCESGEPLEAVSERMRALKVGAFPVLHRGHLVGIISETDILRALGELAWHDSGASRITIKVEGASPAERTYELVDLCRRHGAEILAVLIHPILADSATMTTLRVRGERIEELVTALWQAGFDVVDRC